MDIPNCPLCSELTTGRNGETWCDSCQFQILPVKEKDLTIPAAMVKEQWDTRAADKPMLVDVRTLEEYALTSIAGTVFIPMNELPHRFDDLPRNRYLVMYCHRGARSLFAARFLRQKGYPRVHSMEGGIHAWADLDPEVSKY